VPDAPAVDARLVAPESGYEIIDGRLVAVPPAHEPHGNRHSKVNALLEAFVTDAYDVACDMLTRTSETSDIAPDASVYPRARDPKTGGRQLEVLAFEIVDAQKLSKAGKKAHLLSERGVRRVFAVDVPHQRVFEWSRDASTWQVLPDAGAIEDPSLVAALPVEALVKAAKADDAVARALLAKRNPVLVAAVDEGREEGRKQGRKQGREEGRKQGREEGRKQGREEGREEGRKQGREEGRKQGELQAVQQTLVAVLEARGLPLTRLEQERVEGCTDFSVLRNWAKRAATADAAEDIFTDGAGSRA
jgi:Uma2 family endonuclease